MLDIYHAQIGEGNLIELIRKCAPYIGEVQVADVPGPLRAWYRGDQLSPHCPSATRHRIPRNGRHGGLGVRRQ